jgi:uncharacterized membrane protein (UPF0182 family)
MHNREIATPPQTGSRRLVLALAILFLLFISGRSVARFIIDYQWWKELGQVPTWQSMIAYSYVPTALAAVLVFVVLWLVHARALIFAGTRLREHPGYARISTVILLLLAVGIARASVNPWTVVSFFGAQRAGLPANPWRDPVFGNTLSFYLFDLPFYTQFLGLLLVLTFLAAVLFYLAARGWSLIRRMPRWREEGVILQPSDLLHAGGLESALLRGLIALFLVGLAVRAYLGRYDFLYEDHGFLVGVDYLTQWVGLPLQWVTVGVFLMAAVLVVLGRWKLAALPLALLLLRMVIPPIVSVVHVKPNEISLQKPYIVNHIGATRAAFGFDHRLREIPYPAKLEAPIEYAKNQPLLDNVRLWDWRAFHDTVTQIQALRQYYVFKDTDVDRYSIDGKLRQVMLTPRELDITQLPDARSNWINGHFIYTHGYGVVMAEANEISPNGQPVLFVQDAPPKVQTESLKLTRPEIYFGEVTHEPVFVTTQQLEFDYPEGNGKAETKYQGKGGIPIGTFGMRAIAALAEADRNLLLTTYLTPESRMLIRRNVRQRVEALASFIEWDPDPYLVITEAGRLVWVIDGYTTSSRHPYSRSVRIQNLGALNYIRNSVKATVDAYDGDVSMYVFEPEDPIIRAFDAMFPQLFRPASEMPSDIRRHARYPELLFRVQADTYRTYHMTDPEAFYNREDLWDVANNVYAQATEPEPLPPTFVVATLPGETTPEFLLIQPFTPRTKDNLIGVMVARSDGEHLGKIVVLQLSKQSLIYGPLQIEARITSDATISKDLSLWNQQGSQVLRGHTLVLPINETFLYVEPIYIQSQQARMPQLKKVVLAMGNRLVYRDTYDEALAELAGTAIEAPVAPASAAAPAETSAAPPPQAGKPAADARMQTVRDHLRRYRELASQGKWAEAGRELEALERVVNR